jgi:hypothetical protein
MSQLPQLDVAQRLSLVDDIGSFADGASLAGKNVNALPEGVIVLVRSTGRVYQLRSCTATQVVATPAGNVILGVGSPATGVGKRWVALQQTAQATLAGGTATVLGFALKATDVPVAFLVTVGGTAGFLHAAQATDHSITVTSTQGADTSVVQILVIPQGAV